MKRIRIDMSIRCIWCDRQFQDVEHLKDHMSRQLEEHRCPVCGDRKATKATVENHLRLVHNDTHSVPLKVILDEGRCRESVDPMTRLVLDRRRSLLGSTLCDEPPACSTESAVDVEDLTDGDIDQTVALEQATELNKGKQRSPVVIEPKPGSKPALQVCMVCNKVCQCKYNIVHNGEMKHACGEECFTAFRNEPGRYLKGSLQQNCGFCSGTITSTRPVNLSVEEQRIFFCGKSCQDDYIKMHTCRLCKKLYKDLNKADNCFLSCVGKAGQSAGVKLPIGCCSVCQKSGQLKHQASLNRSTFCYCSEICLSSSIKGNTNATITFLGCEQCGRECPKSISGTELFTLQFEGRKKTFCSGACTTQFKASNSHLVACSWCRNKKQSADMLAQEEDGMVHLFCALSCLSLYRVDKQATSTSSVKCDKCDMIAPALYHLTMSDASIRNFCSFECVQAFQSQFTAPKTPQNTASTTTQATGRTQTPQTKGKTKGNQGAGDGDSDDAMQISNVVSLATNEVHQNANYIPRGKEAGTQITSPLAQHPIGNSIGGGSVVVIVKPQEPIVVRNKSTTCKPTTATKATSFRIHTQSKETQTDESMEKEKLVLIPVPVPIPIYIPVPMPMYSVPVPHPLPMGIPVPVPVFIPTTRNSASGILKQIEKIRDTLPADPYEAEMLLMAEAVAGCVKADDTDSDSEVAANGDLVDAQEDILSLAFRMATEMPTGSVEDFESSVNPTTINPLELTQSHSELSAYDTSQGDRIIAAIDDSATARNTKRKVGGRPRGRPKKVKVDEEVPIEEKYQVEVQPVVAVPQPEVPLEHNTLLKLSYGVNAWKHWVAMKNMELEKTATVPLNRLKLFKLDLLSCSPNELNYALSLFVKEVKKPNGDEYASDSIYYLCLGVQEYLLENGRVDNIFTDYFYETFSMALNEVLQNYEVCLNAQGLIVCRIEEEHLWEAKQLGAHSPHVLLNTLVYFNTKYFLLRTPDDHLRLSFGHIMKRWKKTGKAGDRSVYLRFYDPIQKGRPKEEIPELEQSENVDNPLRCPVKLYDFYLSNCPESIKNRNDVFYLTPERSCVPDSPVWYSTVSLGYDAMARMLNRIRVVKEIQEAHLMQSHGLLGGFGTE